MLIGYKTPTGMVATVEGVAAINAAALTDGEPASVARLAAGSGSLLADWPAPAAVRIVGLLGLTCPAGAVLVLTGKQDGDADYGRALGGNAAGQAVVQLPDGSRACWFVLPETGDPLVGVAVTFADFSTFDIGELVVMQAVDLPHQIEWQVERIDPSQSERTKGGGLNVVPARTYRRLKAALTPAALAAVRGGGLAGGMDWDALTCALAGGRRAVTIPRWKTPAGAVDATELHLTAVYGVATIGAIGHLGCNWYGAGVIADEIPPK